MLKARIRTTWLAPAIWLMLASMIFAQKGPPPPDDPEVHYSFFVFMDGFGQWLDARSQANPARKLKLMDSASRYLKITPAELPKVIDACRLTLIELKAIEAQSQEYWRGEMEKGNNPDSSRVRQFDAMRQAAIKTGQARLQQALSPTSWGSLKVHINGEHRLRVYRNR